MLCSNTVSHPQQACKTVSCRLICGCLPVESDASLSLTTVGLDVLKFRSALLRLAFASGAPASAAVLQSLLAVASLHRYGHQPRAAQYKLSAIQLLNESSKRGLGTKETIQHGAAGMLLASFEVRALPPPPPSPNLLSLVSSNRKRGERKFSSDNVAADPKLHGDLEPLALVRMRLQGHLLQSLQRHAGLGQAGAVRQRLPAAPRLATLLRRDGAL